MKTKSKTSFLSILFIAALLFYAYVALEYSRKIDSVLAKTILQFSRHLIHIGLLLDWILSIRRRILHPAIRRYLLSVGTLLAFWLYIRTCKWMFFPPGACWQCRYLWYAYYIPLILVPLSGLFLALYLGKPESYRLPHNMIFACIPAFFLLILVFTNDLHQLVFRFPNGFASAESDYTYGPGYFLILAWCICLGIFFVATLSGKCRVPGRKQSKKLPLLVLAAAVILSIFYCLRILKFDLTAMDCLIIVLLLESCIQSGLIRSNSGYRHLFEAFSMEAQIEDDQGNLFCCSKRAAGLDQPTKNWMKNPKHINKVLHTKRLRSAKIRNGHILWLEDISEILSYTEKLEKTAKKLSGQNDLLEAENRLREKQLHIQEKNRLYSRISTEVSEQIRQLEQRLPGSADTQNGKERMPAKNNIARICVLSSYIKRRSNLCLMSEKDSCLDNRELQLCLQESLENLKLCNIACALNFRCCGKSSSADLIALYDAMQSVFEQILFRTRALLIKAELNSSCISVRIQIDPITLEKPLNACSFLKLGGTIDHQKSTDACRITFKIGDKTA